MNKPTTTETPRTPYKPNRKMAAVAFWMLRQRIEELQRGVLHLRTLSSNRVDEDALPLSCIENMLSLASTQALSLEHAAHAGGVGDLTKMPKTETEHMAEWKGKAPMTGLGVGLDVRVGDRVSWQAEDDGGEQRGVVDDVQETLVFVNVGQGRPCQPVEKSKLWEVVR